MISRDNSVFEQSSFLTDADFFFKTDHSRFRKFLKKIQPDITLNVTSTRNYHRIAKTIEGRQDLKILIIGGSVDGVGINILKQSAAGSLFIESDVSHGPNTNIIFDSHQIPFSDELFDLVIVQAVLEHVLDPQLCVHEIHRVLKDGATVYAETPFMQQVHGGKYDFQRFSHLGHRRLFRFFTEINSGVVVGPASALAWASRYFVTSFAQNKKTDMILSYFINFFVFWIKYFDLILIHRKGSIDAASGYFFWGKKKKGYILPDKELLESYRGFRF